jgi:hypothetical protein
MLGLESGLNVFVGHTFQRCVEQEASYPDDQVTHVSYQEDPWVLIAHTTRDANVGEVHEDGHCESIHDFGDVDGGVVVLANASVGSIMVGRTSANLFAPVYSRSDRAPVTLDCRRVWYRKHSW